MLLKQLLIINEGIKEHLIFSNCTAGRQIGMQIEIDSRSSKRIRERVYLEEKAIHCMGQLYSSRSFWVSRLFAII